MIWGDRELLAGPGLDRIVDPDLLFARADCELIKDQLKIKVGRVVLDVAGVSTAVYLKRYNVFSPRYRVVSLIVSSGAVKSLRGAKILLRLGISTGRPLAAIESRAWGMLESSFFLSEEISRGKTLDVYWREHLLSLKGVEGFRRRRRFLKTVAQLFKQLHQGRVYHNDLKDANILVDANRCGSERLCLLDLEGVRQCWYLSRRRRIKNLVQLNRTFGRFLTQTEKLCLLRFYLECNFKGKFIRRRWTSDILRATEKADHRSQAKASA
jgi:serine/threonine protein kinase